jgi:hypothetical protein
VLIQEQADPASLESLHDIVAAPPVPLWPPAPGWYFLALAVLALIAWAAWHGIRKRRANAYRRAALRELDYLFDLRLDEAGAGSALRALPGLLKRTALAAWPRAQVASLNGREWLDFLDRTGNMEGFGEGAGSILTQIAYRSNEAIKAIPDNEVSRLFDLSRDWIKRHRIES